MNQTVKVIFGCVGGIIIAAIILGQFKNSSSTNIIVNNNIVDESCPYCVTWIRDDYGDKKFHADSANRNSTRSYCLSMNITFARNNSGEIRSCEKENPNAGAIYTSH